MIGAGGTATPQTADIREVIDTNRFPASSRAGERDAAASRFGLPTEAYARAWRIHEIADYLGLEVSAAYRLMRDPSAPPRLRTGSKAYRWDGEQVMAWIRHLDWTAVHSTDAGGGGYETSVAAPGRPGAPQTTTPARVVRTGSTTPAPAVRPSGPPAATTGPQVRVVEPARVQQRDVESRMAALLTRNVPDTAQSPVTAARNPQQSSTTKGRH